MRTATLLFIIFSLPLMVNGKENSLGSALYASKTTDPKEFSSLEKLVSTIVKKGKTHTQLVNKQPISKDSVRIDANYSIGELTGAGNLQLAEI
ncbi:hypothetical protein A2462_03100 [candidate division WOR-1 bacterium RIFOXYC2_FULL_41_25]|uniref:Uncharacterized protein n=1 Tax=candidate division WOR-1 bacterium RIFOXYC2_FULL_41_25 TaxID=1802586 RepID=A0A1F4TPP9_UNCSA|nr:MAG: hypothetical protein A2385_06120 [Bdellovibrionales bacterium RIFOXYB1_FULL_39_21]OFZ41855.1 MAG: hypothetical protein A2485_08090 [Bdellovibrionales bacterium RIFOXYC12_FULL_39_17]OFZ50571.1 MAG: hypothetical protein A2404_05040 [Bdellovibrionales bacterium RIFOXYC1_FULL_39_130]OFZ77794.1 MAG: hypothetical protein A2560_00210 [Bdellovibrionales bacterium RIFOXYD1_FULL_39_84]OFZ93770.1 MAG: hypothetical protein A2504_05705 [Bdellovibrionales bacterium RIFOXYD12_FULL_39_22]OGC34691.1 MA